MSDDARAEKIDFKKYRTKELYDSIAELIDYRGTLGKGFWQACIGSVLLSILITIILCGVSYYLLKVNELGTLFICVSLLVNVPLCFPGGIFYAVAYLVRKSLDNMLAIVDLLLETTKRVARDVRAVRSGSAQLPSAKELVRGVYLDVFLPILEQLIADQLWILGKPVLFVYRLTFGRLMRLVIQMLPERALDQVTEFMEDDSVQGASEKITGQLEAIAEHEGTAVAAMTWTQQKLHSLGGKALFAVMLPCYAVCGLLIMLNVGSMLAVWTLVVLALNSASN